MDRNGTRKRLILVWDGPNMGLSPLLRVDPGSPEQPSPSGVARWLANRAGDRGLDPVATVFINVSPTAAPAIGAMTASLRSAGFGVYARPKQKAGDDVDEAMVGYLLGAVEGGEVGEVIVASRDRRAFAHLLWQFAASGIVAGVLAQGPCAKWVQALDGVSFIELDSIMETFAEPPPAADLAHLPAGGGFFPAFTELQGAADKAVSGESECPGVRLLLRALADLAQDSHTEWVRKAHLHPRMKRLDPTFTMQAHGYKNLNNMLAACGASVKTRQAVGDHELTLTNGRIGS